MAKIHKLKKDNVTIYPATITQAVIDPISGKTVKEEFAELVHKENYLISNSDVNVIGFMRPAGTTSTSSAYRYSGKLNCKGGVKLYITSTVLSESVSPAVFFDVNDNYISGYTATITSLTTHVIDVPSNAHYFITSLSAHYLANNNLKIEWDVYITSSFFASNKARVYISTDGLDTNTGDLASPVLTLRKAIRTVSKTGEIIVLNGDYVGEVIDFSDFNILKAASGARVRFIYGNKVVLAPLSGANTRVYETNYVGAIAANSYLWQHDIEDEETVIAIADRHPLHRGKRTRMSSTRIYPAASIAEIESTTDKLMWFKSGDTVYFSKTNGSDLSVNPVVIPYSVSLYATKEKNISFQNIEFLYCNIKTQYLSGKFIDCYFGMSNNSGMIIYDLTTGLSFENCEVSGGNNDGFNGHTYTPNSFKHTKQTNVTSINCYSHDNSDDGDSCHEYSETNIIGGLYEFNGNGITPAAGGHCNCTNVMASNNGVHNWTTDQAGKGFNTSGAATDDGVGTNIYCYGCISKNNIIGFLGLDVSSKFINCISQNNTTPFISGEQINCVTI